VLASAESTIPASFPVLAAIARRAFEDIDMDFFHRHGSRDDGHACDAALLVVATADSSQFSAMASAIQHDLDCRAELLDSWIGITCER
jgi:pyrroloquinoline quinone (PQQ) biosynthesis protein C